MRYFTEDIKNTNEINILPMIDVIFAILSFLIISSLQLSHVETIPIDLPKATSSIHQTKNFITISINKQGEIFINQKKTLLNDIRLNIINSNKKFVVLYADKNATHGNVINVLDILRSIDDLKIAISTSKINK